MQIVTNVPPPPCRPDDAHKGVFGTVIVVGGCPTMIGGPALAASGAFRGGAGLVKIASAADVLPYAITIEPGATGIALGDDADESIAALRQADPDGRAVLAVGPGMGRGAAAGRLVDALLHTTWPMVLDADGLNHLAADGQRYPDAKLIMTPHPGEFRRLAEPLGIGDDPTDPDARPQAAAKLARAHQAVVLLKGSGTVVCDGDRLYVNTTGNPALATAGSGDVLTGLIAALIAQSMDLFEAAVLGSYLHGAAADLWRDKFGPAGMTARDLADLLPQAMQNHRTD